MTKIEGAGPHPLIPEALNNELINSFKEIGVIHNGPTEKSEPVDLEQPKSDFQHQEVNGRSDRENSPHK